VFFSLQTSAFAFQPLAFSLYAMTESPQDLKPRTKAFALRGIRIYSKLPKSDTVAQLLSASRRAPLSRGH
jgi:hypothetical protein